MPEPEAPPAAPTAPPRRAARQLAATLGWRLKVNYGRWIRITDTQGRLVAKVQGWPAACRVLQAAGLPGGSAPAGAVPPAPAGGQPQAR